MQIFQGNEFGQRTLHRPSAFAASIALQALVDESQKHVTGTIRVKLYKGNIITAGRKSPVSLYNPDIATMEADPTKAYNQDDATGFIRLNALRLKVAAQVHGEVSREKAQKSQN